MLPRIAALVAVAAVAAAAPRGAVSLAAGAEGDGGPMTHGHVAKEAFAGWSDTYRVTNGLVEARVVADVGPRIVELRRVGGPNLFLLRDAELGGVGEAEWKFRGGWRLWVAPERRETTYAPDNTAASTELVGDGTVRVTGPVQPAAGIQKIVEVSAPSGEPRIRVRSRIRNVAKHVLTYAAWSLPVLRSGGRAFVPLDVGPLDAFDATRKLILWSYTELGDPRYRFTDRLVEIDHAKVPPYAGRAPRGDDESKLGVDSAQGWAAYLLEGTLFVKRFGHDPHGTYPDGGATIEVYSNSDFLELENLGPLTRIKPREEIELVEDWWVFTDVVLPTDPTEALAVLQTHVQRAAFP